MMCIAAVAAGYEQENAALRRKNRSRPEDAAAELKELVVELKHKSCAANFPASVPRH